MGKTSNLFIKGWFVKKGKNKRENLVCSSVERKCEGNLKGGRDLKMYEIGKFLNFATIVFF